jgi:hypothetical protein
MTFSAAQSSPRVLHIVTCKTVSLFSRQGLSRRKIKAVNIIDDIMIAFSLYPLSTNRGLFGH